MRVAWSSSSAFPLHLLQTTNPSCRTWTMFSSISIFFFVSKTLTAYAKIQRRGYVDVYMKWKKDPFYDSIESIHKSIELKRVIALKNCIAREPSGCIPISAVSKRGGALEVPMKVARFLRLYPSVFEEYTGPMHNLPWFRLTPEASVLAEEERKVYEDHRLDLPERVKKLILMSKEKMLPLRIIQGMQWYLGLPDDFLTNLCDSFRFVDLGDDTKGLKVNPEEKFISVMQINAIKTGRSNRFPLFPSKSLKLKRKIEVWLKDFQNLPYISPYEDFSHLDPNSDLAEKRIVGVVHELLSLFVEHSAERRKLFCLKKFMALPQKFHKVFERHPHMFYLSRKNRTCTAILKEAYCDRSSIDAHPLAEVRSKYIALMMESKDILKKRRINNHRARPQIEPFDLDSESDDDEKAEEADSPHEIII